MAETRTTPYFFEQPHVDRLMRMVMTLAAEVAVLRERIDTHEQVAAGKNLFAPTDIEAYEASDEIAAAREAWRNRFIDRLLKLMSEDMEEGR
jgi:hypothetical protein